MDCPAIVNESLQGNPIVQNLVALKFKIRLSSATFENSVIIPTSAVAFFLLPVRDVIPCRPEASDVTELLDKALLSKIRKFSSGHRNAYVILLSQQFSETEIKAHQLLQEHFMKDRTTVLAALSHKNCADVICSVARQFNRKFANEVAERLRSATSNNGITFEQACQALSQSGLSEDNILCYV